MLRSGTQACGVPIDQERPSIADHVYKVTAWAWWRTQLPTPGADVSLARGVTGDQKDVKVGVHLRLLIGYSSTHLRGLSVDQTARTVCIFEPASVEKDIKLDDE